MKLKNSSDKILKNIKSKGFKFIELDSVIETNHIVERSGETFRNLKTGTETSMKVENIENEIKKFI